MQSKTTVESKAIKGASMRNLTRGQIVFALIEKSTRLLAAQGRHDKARSMLLDFDFAWRVAINQARYLLESFELAHAHVVVDVYHQGRQQISFGINEAVCIRISRNKSTPFRALLQTHPPPVAINRFGASREKP